MSTPSRFWAPNSYFHITNRGNRKENLFLDERDFTTFHNYLKETFDYYKDSGHKLICYCLMKNHFHLLLKTGSESFSPFMQRLCSSYAKYFNGKYDLVGHVFQDRYFSKLIDSDVGLLDVSKYIHLNPVRANIVEDPADYKWSSYNKIIEGTTEPPNMIAIENSNELYIHSYELLELFNIYFEFNNLDYADKTPAEKYLYYIFSSLEDEKDLRKKYDKQS